MFPLKVLNCLRDGQDIVAEVAPALPNHRAYVYVTPQVDPELATWDKVNYRWLRVYVEEGILTGYKVNYLEIETKQIDSHFDGYDIDIEPITNERFYVTSEQELGVLVSQWANDLSIFRNAESAGIPLLFQYLKL